VILVEQPEVTAPRFTVLASDLLARCFPEEWCILVVEVGVLGVAYVTVIAEVSLSASVVNLVPEWGLGGQPVEQTLPIPVSGCFDSVRVRSLWSVAHTQLFEVGYHNRWDYREAQSRG
jgi:hypothetical protein